MLNFNITNQTVPEIKTILVKNGKWQLVKKQNLSDSHLNDQLSRELGRYLLEWVTSISLLKQGKQLFI